MLKKEIGERLQAARKRAKLSQQEVATATGVSRTTITNQEAGRTMPTLLHFRSLVALYGGTGYAILFGENPFELTQEEAKELQHLAKQCSPQLQQRITMLLAILSKAGADRASRR